MSALRHLLDNRAFLAVWSAQLVSGLGDKIAVIALYLLVYRLAGRAVDLGLLAAVQILPAVLIGPLAGVLLDRVDRRRAMIWSETASALVVALIPFARTLPQVYVLAGLLSVGRQICGPARLALVPDLVGRAQLARANALSLMTQNLVLLLGPAAGGAIVALWGTSAAFVIDAGTFLASAALLAAPRLAAVSAPRRDEEPAAGAAGAAARAARELREGAAWLWRQPRLRFALVFLGTMSFVTAMQQPLVVLFVKDVLARGDVDLGLVLSAAGLGGLCGALGAGLLGRVRRPLRTVTWLMAVDGLALVLFAVNRSFGAALLLFGLFGALGTIAQINLATFLQRETPEERRGRVFGWLGALLGPLSLLSVFAGPLAADAVGVVAVLALSGLLEIGVGLAGRAALPALNSRRRASVRAQPPEARPAPSQAPAEAPRSLADRA